MIEQMRVLEAAQPLWAWGMDLLPEDRPGRYLVGAVAGSLLLHVAVVAALLLTGWLHNPLIANRGDLLFVEPIPARSEEPAAAPPSPPASPERVKAPPAPAPPERLKAPPAPVPPPVAPPRAAMAPPPRAAAVTPPAS